MNILHIEGFAIFVSSEACVDGQRQMNQKVIWANEIPNRLLEEIEAFLTTYELSKRQLNPTTTKVIVGQK